MVRSGPGWGLEKWCSGRMEEKHFEGMVEDKDPGGNGSKWGCFEPLPCWCPLVLSEAIFPPLQERSLSVRCGQDLGPIVLIRLHKKRLFLEDAWFCKDVRVTAPGGALYRFPCYQWLEGVTTVEVREGSGKTRLAPLL